MDVGNDLERDTPPLCNGSLNATTILFSSVFSIYHLFIYLFWEAFPRYGVA